MKGLNLLVWLTQLGLSVAVPIGGYLFLGLWLHQSLGMGKWVLILCISLGILCGGRSLWDSLKVMERMAAEPKQEDPPTISFHDHK